MTAHAHSFSPAQAAGNKIWLEQQDGFRLFDLNIAATKNVTKAPKVTTSTPPSVFTSTFEFEDEVAEREIW